MKLLSTTLALVLTSVGAVHSMALGPVFSQEDAAKQLADKVSTVIGNNKEVFVREFRSFGDEHVGLAKQVGEVLASNHDIVVRRGANVEIEGRLHRFPKNPSLPVDGYTISATVLTPDGERRFSFDLENRDEGEIALGQSGEKIAPPEKPHGSLPDKTGPFLDGNIIRPSQDSPYGVEFMKETQGTYLPLKPHVAGSSITVKVRKGDLVACRLHNTSGFEAAVLTLVDGLSRFALAENSQKRKGFDLVAHRKNRLIKGYFLNNHHVDAFRVGEYSRSPAAKLLPDGKESGTFTIAFRAAWAPGSDPPPNETNISRQLGIERGPKRDDRTRHVSREIGGVRAIIKIAYEE